MEFKRSLLWVYFKGLFSMVVLKDLQKGCIDNVQQVLAKGELLFLGLTEV